VSFTSNFCLNKKTGYLIGIHGFSASSRQKLHNTGVALIKDGEIISAIDEERLSRIKNEGSFPFNALEEICRINNLKIEDIELIALPDREPLWQLAKIIKYVVRTFWETKVFMGRYLWLSLKRTLDIRRTVPEKFKTIPKVFVEHHLAHAASAYYTSPWREATIITIDGMGDYCMSGIIAEGINGKMNVIKRMNGFYSPGIFYTIITDLLGFTAGRHEGKVTGLAAFGNPNKSLLALFDDFLTYKTETLDFYSKILPYEINKYSFKEGKKEPIKKFRQTLKIYSKENIAAAVQFQLEKTITELVIDVIKITKNPKVVFAGGIFANVKLNQKIQELDCVENVYIFPAMSDSGLSVGAAMYAQYNILKKPFNPFPLKTVFLGKEYFDNEIELILKKKNIKYEKPENIEKEIAKLISEGKIVAHFYGKMEYGPRALGNRSIFAPATNFSINKSLNKKLNRTEFMPFAPIILFEDANEMLLNWNENEHISSFMTITYNVTDKMKEIAPAVIHIDDTARPQIIKSSENERVYDILLEYKKITGIPILINTSFNLHEEPIVNTPEDALKVLEQKAVDVLVINNFYIEKV